MIARSQRLGPPTARTSVTAKWRVGQSRVPRRNGPGRITRPFATRQDLFRRKLAQDSGGNESTIFMPCRVEVERASTSRILPMSKKAVLISAVH